MVYEKVYIGLDESNHGKPKEVVVAVFSAIPGDATPRKFKNVKDTKLNRDELLKYLRHPFRDYLSAYINPEDIEEGGHQLVYAAPRLIGEYMRKRRSIRNVEIISDGEMTESQIKMMRTQLIEVRGLEGIKIKNYRKRASGEFKYPLILQMADRLANDIFRARHISKSLGLDRRLLDLTRSRSH